MKIQLSDHFTLSKLLRFVFPSIIMMIFTSIYSVVDGLFVSNFVGKTAFASVNLIMPFIMIPVSYTHHILYHDWRHHRFYPWFHFYADNCKITGGPR